MSVVRHEKKVGDPTGGNPPSTTFAGILINVTGAQLVVIQPGFVLGLVKYGGFSDAQAGFLVSVETFGFMLTAVAMIYLANKFDWRSIARGMILLMIAGNLLSAFWQQYLLLTGFRFIAGLGAGGLVSLGFAVLGLSRKPDRAFSYAVMCVMSYGVIVMPLLPKMYWVFGLNSIMALFATVTLIALVVVHFLPASGRPPDDAVQKITTRPGKMRLLVLASIFTYWVAHGAVWSYLFLIGTASGITEQQVAYSLTLSQVAGFAGAATVAVIALRFGRLPPLAGAILATVAMLSLMLGSVTLTILIIVVCVYNYAWNLSDPFLLGTASSVNLSGSGVVQAVAVRKLGFAIGPAVAALIIRDGDYTNVVILGIVMFMTSLGLIWQPAKIKKNINAVETVSNSTN